MPVKMERYTKRCTSKLLLEEFHRAFETADGNYSKEKVNWAFSSVKTSKLFEKRMRRAISCLPSSLNCKPWEFFYNKLTAVNAKGNVRLRWLFRKDINKPEAPDNEQTAQGIVLI